jgi:hypothetical protein
MEEIQPYTAQEVANIKHYADTPGFFTRPSLVIKRLIKTLEQYGYPSAVIKPSKEDIDCIFGR